MNKENNIALMLKELANLKSGWLGNDYGKPPPKKFLHWFECSYNKYLASYIIDPYVYPTPEGGLSVEWDSAIHVELSLEIDCHTRIGDFMSARKENYYLIEEIIDLNTKSGWIRLKELLLKEKLGKFATGCNL